MTWLNKNLSFLKVFYFPIILYILWRILIIIFQVFFQPLYKITPDSDTLYERLFYSWLTYWDSSHYLSIAQNGYIYPQQAFFPLWPLIIKPFLLIPNLIGAYFLIILLGLANFILFYYLCSLLLGKKQAKLSLLFFCSFPTAMYLLTLYTENLFIFFILLFLILIEKKRFFLAAVIGGFLSSTRLVGIVISFVFIFLKISVKKKIAYILITFLGVFGYVLYLQLTYNDLFLFSKAQKEWCSITLPCKFTFPLDPLITYFNLIMIGWVKPSLHSNFVNFITALLFIAGSFFVLKKLKFYYFIFTLGIILTPLSVGINTIGMMRYVLPALPIFFVFPSIIKPKIFFYSICLLLFLLQLRFVALYSSRLWID